MIIDSIKLRKFRERKKLSQTEFAQIIGLSQTTIFNWEKEDSNIKVEHFNKLYEVFGEDVIQLTKENSHLYINQNNSVSQGAVIGNHEFIVNIQNQELINELKQLMNQKDSIIENQNQQIKLLYEKIERKDKKINELKNKID